MAKILKLTTHQTETGDLTVFEKHLPGGIKRVFYIQSAFNAIRGGHRHHKTYQALICVKGSCRVFSDDGVSQEYFILDKPELCLILEPKDWHIMDRFSEDAILLVISNEFYDKDDYIDEPYR